MKEAILEKATEMFLNIGFKSVTMDDISTELGISKKTIYSHFKNKTMLVEQSTACVFKDISAGIMAIKELKKNPIEELFEIKNFIIEALKNNQNSPQYQLQKFFPKIHFKLKSKQLELALTCITDNLQRGILLGVYRKDIDIGFVSRIYFVGVTGIKDLEIFPSSFIDQTSLDTFFLQYHITAIATKNGLEILKNTLIKLK